MESSDIKEPLFRQAVEAIDAGNPVLLESIISKHPELLRERINNPEPGYFQHPYLLWFVAGNPIRINSPTVSIIEITRILVAAVNREAAETAQQQLDYTLGLVATGSAPRKAGVQLQLMDLLIEAGATPRDAVGAIAHGNIAAAKHLIAHGVALTLPVAVGLDLMEEARLLAANATAAERLTALTVAAFNGNPDMIRLLLDMGIDPNAYPEPSSGFHSHATPLHQAVFSGSLESVQLLINAGAKTWLKDRVYDGTALGWAKHMELQAENGEQAKEKYRLIGQYLQDK